MSGGPCGGVGVEVSGKEMGKTWVKGGEEEGIKKGSGRRGKEVVEVEDVEGKGWRRQRRTIRSLGSGGVPQSSKGSIGCIQRCH